MRKGLKILATASAAALGMAPALADEPRLERPLIDEIVVFGRAIDLIGEARAGSQGVVGYSDFELRPLSRVGELVEVIPGLIATQHSGTGKANQYFLRGFNLDHGTDFAAFIDGTPINFRSHGHGQGYLDLNFIIPEIIERVEFRKGPYYSDVGDFTAAATAAFQTYDQLPQGIAQVSIGEFGYRRGLIAKSFDTSAGSFLIAGEAVLFDNPYELDENLEKFNGFAKYSHEGGVADWHASLSAYDARWSSTDQVPQRSVDNGAISRLGFIDPDLGGETTRIALNGDVSTGEFNLSAYALYYDFALFSNFTYFANDVVNGDEFEQRDERFTIGGALDNSWIFDIGGKSVTLRSGGDIRYDDVLNLGLFNTVARQRFNTIRNDDIREVSVGGFAEIEIVLTDRLRASAGLRGDFYAFDVEASLSQNSGDGSASIATPTAGLAWRATNDLELYANYGHGFHSNDVRGAAIGVDPVTREPADPVDLLVRAEGGEIGARLESGDIKATIVGFWLDVDSELVFVGDAGTTQPNDGSRRFGVELNGFWRPADWITIDATAAYTDAKYKGVPSAVDRIPQAVEFVGAAGITVQPIQGFAATMRVRHFGAAPLIEDGSAFSNATTIVNFGAYYDVGRVRLGLDILNLLDSRDADITYLFESRLAGESAPVEDIHLHPVEPRQIRGSVSLHF